MYIKIIVHRRWENEEEKAYLHTRFLTIHLPLEETFIIKESTDHILTVNHKMWISRILFLHIHYKIKRIEKK